MKSSFDQHREPLGVFEQKRVLGTSPLETWYVGKWVGVSGEGATFAVTGERRSGWNGEETQKLGCERQ